MDNLLSPFWKNDVVKLEVSTLESERMSIYAWSELKLEDESIQSFFVGLRSKTPKMEMHWRRKFALVKDIEQTAR